MHFTKLCLTAAVANINEKFRVKIGLEIHARINSNTKIFSSADTSTLVNTSPNLKASFFDGAFPGTMPTLNRRCVEAAILTGLALNCKINSLSYFERKHYFYPDLPLGYQITQQNRPIAVDGFYEYTIFDYKSNKMVLKTVKIKRIQLEHDSARTISMTDNNCEVSLIDLNRCGLGLMEIVTEPNFSDSIDTSSFVYELSTLLKELNVCEANVKDGGLRVDCNISVHKIDENKNEEDSARIELKNINNLSSIRKAIDFEVDRQIKLKLDGKQHELVLQTRGYDAVTESTYLLRIKDTFYDYRFMPESNLLPFFVYTINNSSLIDTNCLLVDESYDEYMKSILNKQCDDISGINIDSIIEMRQKCQLPKDICKILTEKYKLTPERAFLIVSNKLDKILVEMLNKNEDLNSLEPKTVTVYFSVLMIDYLLILKLDDKISGTFTVDKLIELVNLVKNRKINTRLKAILLNLAISKENENKALNQICMENDLNIINDKDLIVNHVNKILDSPNSVKSIKDFHFKENYRDRVYNKLKNTIQKELNQRADGNILSELLTEGLNKRKP